VGCYVNPSDGSKEDWLFANGEFTEKPKSFGSKPEGTLPVCLVDNGPFTAAAVAFDASEFKEFIRQRENTPSLVLGDDSAPSYGSFVI